MRTMKTLALAAFAASALALAGCGGGGSKTSSVTAPTGGDDKKPADTTSMALVLPSADNAYLDADDTTLDAGTFTVAAGETETRGAYTFTCGGDEDCSVTVAADGDVTETGGVTVAYSAAAMTTISEAKTAASEEMHERALGLELALRKNEVAADSRTAGLKITRGESGSASITRKGWTGTAASSGVEGWHGMKLDSAGLLNKGQSLTVYTNIEAAKRAALWGTGGLYTGTAGQGDDAGVTVGQTSGVNTHLSLAGTLGKNQAAYLDKSRFPQPGATKPTTYGTGSSDSHKREFPGTFRGASGTYKCTSTDTCSVTAPGSNAESSDYTLAGTWIFTPGAGQKGVKMDTSHMHFGWWIKTPSKKDSGGDYVYDVEVFSDQTGTEIADGMNALTGTATYMGAAGGVYVNKTGEGDSLAATHGTFTADAELVADFSATGTGTGTAGSLTGEIGNFRGGSGMEDWSVTLGIGAVDDDGDVTGGKTSGTGTGTWTAEFHGSATSTVTAAPAGVHGTFNAHSNTTNIVGAFGADKQ